MITKLTIVNFKKFERIEFDLQSPVVLVGPNNSGKTSLLQAITLLDVGLKKLTTKKDSSSKTSTSKRPGITINRKDLISIPTPSARLLWFNKSVRSAERENGKQKTKNITIEIQVDGYSNNEKWFCGLEFDYLNEESFFCRPLRKDTEGTERFSIEAEARKLRVAYLQPMSGLASSEDRLTPGSIERKIGEGKTADVIRNICYQLLHPDRAIDFSSDKEIELRWKEIQSIVNKKFGVTINPPRYNPDNGLLDMSYAEGGNEFDLSNAGRGFQQTLLLLCFLFSNPNKIILMDEPDAHLEVLRQKEIYHLITDITRKLNSQLIIASHSEIVLREAAQKDDDIVAILEQQAIKLNDPKLVKEFRKSLTNLGWDKYYLARLKNHVVYLEGTTDTLNLEAFAKILDHPAARIIGGANIDPVETNLPGEAFNRYASLRLISPNLKALGIFDKLKRQDDSNDPFPVLQWSKREIENYFCLPFLLKRWSDNESSKSLFTQNFGQVMQECLNDLTPPQYLRDLNDKWWSTEKLGDWAELVFQEFYKRTKQPIGIRKGSFHELIALLKPDEINLEIKEKLDALYEVIKTPLSASRAINMP